MPPVIAAAAALWATLEATTILGVTLSSIIVNVALSVGLSLVSSLLMGSQKQPSPHASRQNFRNPLAPRVRALGRVKIGGALALMKLAPSDVGGFNQIHIAVAQAQGHWEAHEEVWLADDKATLDGVTVKYPANYYWNNIPWVQMKMHLGSETQAADSLLMQMLPGLWTEDFHGYGVPYLTAVFKSPKIEDFSNVYSSGLPAISTVARASILFDPRDPNQTRSSRSTWKWTANPIIGLLDTVWNEDGLGLPFDMANAGIDVWELEADYCDQWRALKNGGSEPWFRIGGAYNLTDPPKTWLPKILDPIDGRIVLRSDGAIVPSIGRWREPELTISDNEIISYTGFARGKPKAEVKNRIDATFISPDYDFIQQQADPLIDTESTEVDGEQQTTLDLDWAPSHAQARLRMKIEAGRQDPDRWNGTIVTKAYCLKFLTPNADGSPRRFANFQIAELGVDTSFEVLHFGFNPLSGNGTFQVQEMHAEDFDFDPMADEGTAPAFPRNTANNEVENPFNLRISVAGSVISAAIDAPLNTDFSFSLSTRPTADNVGDDEASWTEMIHDSWAGHTTALQSGRYDVRALLYIPAKDGIILWWINLVDPEPAHYSDPRYIRGIKIGTGAPAGLPASPAAFDAEDCGAQTVKITAQQASDGTVVSIKIWYAAGFPTLFSAAAVLNEYPFQAGNPNELIDFLDIGATGHYNFWATTKNIHGLDSAPLGPIAVTVTGGAFDPPDAVPAAPTGFSAVPSACTIAVECDANPSGDSVIEYEFWGAAGTAGYGACTLLATIAASPTPSTTLLYIDPDTSLQFTPGDDYSLYVVAVNANGTSAPSDVIFVETLPLSRYRAVTAHASPLLLLDTDTWADITNATGADLEIRLPQYPFKSQGVLVTDGGANVATHNWTIKDFSGSTQVDTVSVADGWSASGWTGAVWKLGKNA